MSSPWDGYFFVDVCYPLEEIVHAWLTCVCWFSEATLDVLSHSWTETRYVVVEGTLITGDAASYGTMSRMVVCSTFCVTIGCIKKIRTWKVIQSNLLKAWSQRTHDGFVPRHDRKLGQIAGHGGSSQDNPTKLWVSRHRLADVRQSCQCTFLVRRFFFWGVVSMSCGSRDFVVDTRRILLVKKSYHCRKTILRLTHERYIS